MAEEMDVLILTREEITLLGLFVNAAAQPQDPSHTILAYLVAEHIGAEKSAILGEKIVEAMKTVDSSSLISEVANKYS